MMARQDFERLAEALLSVKKDVASKQAEELRDKMIVEIAAVCMSANHRFDMSRFLLACNGEPYAPPRRRRTQLRTRQELLDGNRALAIQDEDARRARETAARRNSNR